MRQSVRAILGLPVVRVKSLAMQRLWASCGSASSATDSKLAIKRNKLLIYATTYINRKYIVFSERNQTQKLCSVGIDNHISPGHLFQSQHRGVKGTLSVIALLFFAHSYFFLPVHQLVSTRLCCNNKQSHLNGFRKTKFHFSLFL